MAKYSNQNKLKDKLIEKLQIRLRYNNPNNEIDEDLLGLYIDNAIDDITDWRALPNNDELLTGVWDTAIMEFVVESVVANGSEGKSYETTSGVTNQYYADPITNLHTRIPQRIK